ncbi:MAG TPA: GIY-YIG nuclease family protein [Longimicrobiales bacterium]
MPTVTFNWKGPYKPWTLTDCKVDSGGQMIPATWIKRVEWRNGEGNLMGEWQGVYIVENDTNSPVYAGKAGNFRDRFNSRSDAMHELSLDPTLLQRYQVRIATLKISPMNYPRKLDWAERWLVRFLFRRDQLKSPTPKLQNISLTAPFEAPEGGLKIQFTGAAIPQYLIDPKAPGVKQSKATGEYYYSYSQGKLVLP